MEDTTFFPDMTECSVVINQTTSPSQLHEVTSTDPEFASFAHAIGLRSPGDGIRGRSVKEFEENLTTIRKENFNLKLRIYFLEEHMGPDFNMDQEHAIKKNIELNVELESLRKELADKQELLCQAVKAMELEEDEHKKQTEDKDRKNEDLQKELELLLHKYQVIQEEVRSQGDVLSLDKEYYPTYVPSDENTSEIVKQLEDKILDLETKLLEEQSHITELNTQLIHQSNMASNDTYEHYEHLESALRGELEQLTASLEDREGIIVRLRADVGRLEGRVTYAHEELEKCRGILDEERRELQLERQRTERQREAIRQRNGRIVELEELVQQAKDEVEALSVRKKCNSSRNTTLALPSSHTSTTPKSPRRSPNTSTPNSVNNSLSIEAPPSPNTSNALALTTHSHSPSAGGNGEDPTIQLNRHIGKLENERRRACEIIQTMLDKRKKQDKELDGLRAALRSKDRQITELRETATTSTTLTHMRTNDVGKSLQARISERNLTAITGSNDAENPNSSEVSDPKLLITQYESLVNDLDTQKELLIATIKEKDSQMDQLNDEYTNILSQLKIKDEVISNLEIELTDFKQNFSSTEKSDLGTSEKPTSFWLEESNEKDREIDRLEGELKKRTADLQSIVNKELWAKNREIEKIQLRYVNIVEGKDKEIVFFKTDISAKEKQLAKLIDRISEMTGPKMDGEVLSATEETPEKSIEQKLRASINDRKKILDHIECMHGDGDITQDHVKSLQHMQNENKQLQDELERSEDLRQKTNEICSVLSTRLEELAYFLDSLLKQKSILGFLGGIRNGQLRQIIDQSLDLSRSLNMNLTMNPDQSLLQLTNISNLLNASCNNDSITFDEEPIINTDSVVTEQARVITVLRAQVETMKKEIEVRDVELEKKLTSSNKIENDAVLVDMLLDITKVEDAATITEISPQTILDNLMSDKLKIQLPAGEKNLLNTTSTTLKHCENQSESESWSEPDRTVSKQRIGLSPQSISPRKVNPGSTESTEDETQLTLSKSSSKRSLMSTENKQIIAGLHQQIADIESKLKTKEEELLDTQASLSAVTQHLRQEMVELETMKDENGELETTVKGLEREVAQHRVRLCNDNELKRNQQESFNMMEMRHKEINNKLNCLEVEKLEIINRLKIAEQEAANFKQLSREYEDELRQFERQKFDLEMQLGRETEKIQLQHRDFQNQLHNVQRQAESEIQRISESAIQLKSTYEKEYVKRSEVEKMMHSIKELETLQVVLTTTEEKIQLLESSELQLKSKLQDTHQEYREKLTSLRKDLDTATLNYSEVMLEKTKLGKEKSALEVQLNEFSGKEEDFVRQVADFQRDFGRMKEKFQEKVAQLTANKAQLEVRLSEMEATNADLRNKLIKASNVDNQRQSNSMPSSPSKFWDLFIGPASRTETQASSVTNNLTIHHHQFPYIRQFSDGYNSEDLLSSGTGGLVVSSDTVAAATTATVSASSGNGVVDRANGNNSPDLGIESDHGRFSSLEANGGSSSGNNGGGGGGVTRPFLNTLQLTRSMSTMLDGCNREGVPYNNGNCGNEQCLAKVKDIAGENNELRQKLLTTRSALEETVAQLKSANERKKHVEKTICKQIHKTSQVLRKAKANLDSGSESELVKK